VATLDEAARTHLAMARKFLLGDPHDDAWRDPYTARWIALIMFPFRTFAVLASHRLIAVGLAVVLLLTLAALVRAAPRLRQARRGVA